MTDTMRAYRVGDVVRYASDRKDRHCREGQAIGTLWHDGRVLLADTFWGQTGDPHFLTDGEVESATLMFRLDDYEEIGRIWDPRAAREGIWERYAPEDRRIVTSQHGLQARYFTRKGAVEHHATQVANAERRLAEAKDRLESAEWAVKQAERDLTETVDKATSKAGDPRGYPSGNAPSSGVS